MTQELRCALCPGKPFVKWCNQNDEWVWLCVDDAARLGYPAAMQIKGYEWIDGSLESVVSVEAVQ